MGKDRCPFTAQKYNFVSDHLSDFDRDGCADGLEDTDDDGDDISNLVDHCPQTRPGDLPDEDGCSEVQRFSIDYVHGLGHARAERDLHVSRISQTVALVSPSTFPEWVAVI